MVERLNDRGAGHFEPAAQIIPERDAQFVTGLGEAEERVTAIPSDLTAGSGADLPPRDVTADVVLRAVGVQRNFRPFQHHQQFDLVGVQPRQQAVQRDVAGAAKENTAEANPQCPSPGLLGLI